MASVTRGVEKGSIVEINEEQVRGHVDEVVRSSVEETLNGLLDAEADSLCNAKRYERSADRVDSVSETLSYMAFPREHWTRIRTNNPLERIMREIRRRTRVVGAFPDGNSALMLVAARLRHIAGTKWGTRKYLDMTRLKERLNTNCSANNQTEFRNSTRTSSK